jgi:hypothetical protein
VGLKNRHHRAAQTQAQTLALPGPTVRSGVMPDLRSELSALALDFADAVLAAIRGASLEELVADSGGTRHRGPGRPRGGVTTAASTSPRTVARRPLLANGQLARRSPADIEKTLTLVRAMLTASSNKGVRSEEIRKFLKLDKRELPRVLKTGLERKLLTSKGQKRATRYFAA